MFYKWEKKQKYKKRKSHVENIIQREIDKTTKIPKKKKKKMKKKRRKEDEEKNMNWGQLLP